MVALTPLCCVCCPRFAGAHLGNQMQTTNWQVVNCTTPANYFHVLRRQVRRHGFDSASHWRAAAAWKCRGLSSSAMASHTPCVLHLLHYLHVTVRNRVVGNVG